MQNLQNFKYPQIPYSEDFDAPGLTVNKVYRAALATPIPKLDDILSLLLQPQTTPADLHAITAFLQSAATVSFMPSFQALERARHCVRCHTAYTDSNNMHGSCVIKHIFHPHETHQTWSAGQLFVATKCCNRLEQFVSTIGEGPDARACVTHIGGLCFRGYHTEDVREVRYNGVNIVSCVVGPPDHQECTLHQGPPEIFDEFANVDPSLYADLPPPHAPPVDMVPRINEDYSRNTVGESYAVDFSRQQPNYW